MEILIVDDDPVSLNLVKIKLAKIGYQIHEASNGKAAIEILEKTGIGLVLTDWMMPEIDGIDLCRYIRRKEWGRYIYLIIVTSRDQKQDVLDIFEAGADDYVSKPFDFDELKARLQVGKRIRDLENHHFQIMGQIVTSRNKLMNVFDNLQEEIITLDPDLNIVSCNRSAILRLGVMVQDMVGRHCGDMLHGDIVERAKQVFSTQGKSDFFLETKGTDGSMNYHHVVCIPVKDNSEKISRVVVVSKDISDVRRKAKVIEDLNSKLGKIASQLKVKNKKLEQAIRRIEDTQAQMLQSEKMASIGQLAAGVAHEINNPTGFVSSNLKTLSGYKDDLLCLIAKYRSIYAKLQHEDFRTYMENGFGADIADVRSFEEEIDIEYLQSDLVELIDDCREGTDRIKKIVSDLRDFAHPGNEEKQLVDLNLGLESTLNVVNNEIKYKAVVKKMLADIPLVMAYPQQINQVFMNILVNAAQAIQEKGEISIATGFADQFVEVHITDNGQGIEKKNLTRIFDPFFTTKEVGKGTGLGMHIAYNIVKKHNGSIEVQSQVGKGTTFSIRLPIASAENTASP